MEQGKGSAGAVLPDLSPQCCSSPSQTTQIQILLLNPLLLEIPRLVSAFMTGSLLFIKSTKYINSNCVPVRKCMRTRAHTHVSSIGTSTADTRIQRLDFGSNSYIQEADPCLLISSELTVCYSNSSGSVICFQV